MELLLKYVVLFLITIALYALFSICFRFTVKQIYEGYSEEHANEMYLLLKYVALGLVFGFFALILVWKYIGFGSLIWYHKIFVSLFFLCFWSYTKSCIGILSHLICLIYRPGAVGEIEYDGIWGEIKIIDQKPILINEFALLHLDISKRL